MSVVAVYNLKGGVGKTATAVNLSAASAASFQRTLLWDLDPQGAATFYFRIRPRVRKGGRAMLQGKSGASRDIRATNYERLDVVPADFRYRRIDTLLGRLKRPKKRLSRLINPQREDYDFQWIDCAPTISLISESVFEAADVLLMPMVPTTLSLRTLEQVTEFMDRKGYRKPLLPFFTMVDQRKTLHREVMTELPKTFPGMLKTVIPYSSDVERMGTTRAPLRDFAPKSKAAKGYDALWVELQQLLSSAPT